MKVAVSEAKGQFAELVCRAEAGEEVVLTRHGQSVVQLVPVRRRVLNRAERRKILEEIQAEAAAKAMPGPSAEHCTDFLYDENGLPK